MFDDGFSARVMGMRFAGVNNLKRAGIFCDLTQSIQVCEDQIGALVTSGAPRKSDGEFSWVELDAGLLPHNFQQFMFGDQVSRPDFFWRQAQRAAETVVVFPPRGNVAIKNFAKCRSGPGSSVNTVGNGFDRYARKHLARSFAMLLGDTIHVFAQAEREIRHV